MGEKITINGKKCFLFYGPWAWRVWLEGAGDIGHGDSKEAAIEAAKSKAI